MKTRLLPAELLLIPFLFAALPGIAPAQSVDMVTAGGWITGTPSGARANFGVHARDPAAPSGHVNYVDHGTGMHVVSTSITSYEIVNPTTRLLQGTCTIDGVGGFTFFVLLADDTVFGDGDRFELTLSNGYVAEGELAGGNVQLHPGG